MKTKISKKMFNALSKAITIWNKKYNILKKNRGKINTPLINYVIMTDCPLCEITNFECQECPVGIFVGDFLCKETPYNNFSDIYETLDNDERVITMELINAAKKEVLFLQKVRKSCCT
jgi:hypothetical protein